MLRDTRRIEKCVLLIPSPRAANKAVPLGTHLVELLARVPFRIRNSHQVIPDDCHGVAGGGCGECAGRVGRNGGAEGSCGGSLLRRRTSSSARRGGARKMNAKLVGWAGRIGNQAVEQALPKSKPPRGNLRRKGWCLEPPESSPKSWRPGRVPGGAHPLVQSGMHRRYCCTRCGINNVSPITGVL